MSVLLTKYYRLTLLTLVALCMFSCSKQTAEQESELSLRLSCEQSFLSSKSGEGSVTVNRLHYFVFAEGESTPLISGQTEFNPTGTNNLKLRLFKDKAYEIAFWACGSSAPYSFDSGIVSLPDASGTASTPAALSANDPGLEAFYAKVSITGGQGSLSVSLKRAVAKVSVSLSTALSDAASSSLSFDSAYKSFSLLDGEVSSLQPLTFGSASCPVTQNVAYAYIFAPQDQAHSCTMTLKVLDGTGTELLSTALSNIPVQRNIQTNITYNN